MATFGKANIDQEDLQGATGTLRDALSRWVSRKGPVTYVLWQSAYWQLLKAPYNMSDEDFFEGQTQRDTAARMRQMHEEI